MRRVVVGTSNAGKLREIRAILAGLHIELVGLDAFPDAPEIVEDGETFEANAVKKARGLADALGEWVIADDSGLAVDALGGRPGVHSARYAGPERCDAANNAKLMQELRNLPPGQRTAAFRCACALAKPGELIGTADGTVEGVIAFEPRGANGFGYDPVFEVNGLGCTAAELAPAEKNRISHRGRAFTAIKPLLAQALAQEELSR